MKINLHCIFAEYPDVAELLGKHCFDDPQVVRLLKGSGDSYRAKYPPILFPPGKERQLAHIYRNKALQNVSAHIIATICN